MKVPRFKWHKNYIWGWVLVARRDAILHLDLIILGWVWIACMCRAFGRFGVVLRGMFDLPRHSKGCAMLYAVIKRLG